MSSHMYTPYREGYFMTAADEKAAKAMALFDYTEAKQRLALLKHQAEDIAKAFEGGAKLLRTRPEDFGFDGDDAPFKDYRKLGVLVEDIKTTQAELQRLTTVLEKVGLGEML